MFLGKLDLGANVTHVTRAVDRFMGEALLPFSAGIPDMDVPTSSMAAHFDSPRLAGVGDHLEALWRHIPQDAMADPLPDGRRFLTLITPPHGEDPFAVYVRPDGDVLHFSEERADMVQINGHKWRPSADFTAQPNAAFPLTVIGSKGSKGSVRPSGDVTTAWFQTDDLGRVTHLEFDLVHSKFHERNTDVQRSSGGADRLGVDSGGHGLPNADGGVGIHLNMQPQHQRINNNDINNLEQSLRVIRDSGGRVHVQIENVFDGSGLRPTGFNYTVQIEGDARPVGKKNFNFRRPEVPVDRVETYYFPNPRT